MVVAKKFVLAKPFSGLPTDENIKLETEELPALKDGGKKYYHYHDAYSFLAIHLLNVVLACLLSITYRQQ